jgi:hypothetical protein
MPRWITIPKIARMVPLAMGSRISTFPFQRGSSTWSQSRGAFAADTAALFQAMTSGVRYVPYQKPSVGGDGAGPRRLRALQQRVAHGVLEGLRGGAPPDVGLRVRALAAQAVQHLLRPHVQDLHVHRGMQRLIALLERLLHLPPVGGVDGQHLAVVAAAARGEQGGGREWRQSSEDGSHFVDADDWRGQRNYVSGGCSSPRRR